MARKPKNQREPEPADEHSSNIAVLSDDDIGLPSALNQTELPDDEDDDEEEEHNIPSGILPGKKAPLEIRMVDEDPPAESPAEDPPEPTYGDPSRTYPVNQPPQTRDQNLFQDERLTPASGPVGAAKRRDGMPAGLVGPSPADKDLTDRLSIPSPRFKIFSNESTNPGQKSKSAWNWANALPVWAKDRITLYVYRDHPVLNEPEDEDFKYIDKVSGNEMFSDDSDILNRYGCGNYRVLINDVNVKANNKTICTVRLSTIGGGDYKSNPPNDRRVNDVNQVDRFHPSNQSYIKFLQLRGLLPEQNNKKGDDDMPAVVEVIREANATSERMMNKVLEASAERSKDSDVLKEAMTTSIGVMADVNKMGMETLNRAHEQARDIVANAVPAGGQAAPGKDPLEIALQIVQLIQGQNGGQSNSEVLELRRQLAEMQANEIRELRTQLLEVMKTKADSSGLGSLKDTLSNVKELRSLMDELGGGKDEKEAITEAAGDLAPKWLRPYIPILSTVASAAAPAILQFLNPQGGQMPQPNMQSNPGMGAPVPGAPPSIHGSHAQISAPQLNRPGPTAVPAQQPALNEQQQQLNVILAAIQYPLVTHLTDDTKTGEDFAEWFVDGFGMPTFDYLAAFGSDAVASAILAYQPITALMQQQGVAQLRFRTMVSEFCNTKFEDGPEGEQGDGDSPTQPVATGAGPGPGSGSGPAPVPA